MDGGAVMRLVRMGVAGLTILFGVSAAASAGVKVLVVPKGSSTVYWDKVAEGARQAGADLEIDVAVRGPRNDDQHEAQIKIVEYGIKQRVDAIVLAPNHETMAVPVVRQAVAQGIKVVLIDSGMDGKHHSSFVESDNYGAGKAAAAYAASLLAGGGTIAVIRFIENHASTDERLRGFEEELRRYPQARLVASPSGGASVGSAYHAVTTLIATHAAVDLIFSVNESTTVGALRALKEKNLQGRITHIGFDFNDNVRDAILSPEMQASVAQNPYKMGYTGVTIARDLLRGKRVPKKVFTETVLIDAGNYQSPAVQAIVRSNLPDGN